MRNRPRISARARRGANVSAAFAAALGLHAVVLASPSAAQPRPGKQAAAPATTDDAPPSPPPPDAERDAESGSQPSAPESVAPAAAVASDAVPPAPPPRASAEPSAEQRAELAALQAELSQVMDDLVQARARVAVLGKSLFKSRVRVKLDNRAEPEQQAARAQLWLDGAPIWSGDGAALRDPERTLWEGFAAPGAHVLTLEVEQRAQADEAYRYTLRESFLFTVVRERRTDLRLVLDDDSDMAEEFPDDREGSYELQTRLEARAVPLNDD